MDGWMNQYQSKKIKVCKLKTFEKWSDHYCTGQSACLECRTIKWILKFWKKKINNMNTKLKNYTAYHICMNTFATLLLCPFSLFQNVPGTVYCIQDGYVWPATTPARLGCSTGGSGDQSFSEGNQMPAGSVCVSGTVKEQREMLVSTHLYRS